MHIKKLLLLFTICALIATPGFANEEKSGEPSKRERALQRELLELQKEIASIKQRHNQELAAINSKLEMLTTRVAGLISNAQPAEKTAAAPPQASPPATQQQGGGVSGEVFNPKISVISDFLSGYVDQSGQSADDILIRELELGFSGHVDTWGRYDLTMAFHSHPGLEIGEGGHGHIHGEEGGEEEGLETEIEEGYFTFLTLPADLQARVGKIRNRVGKTNPTHLHSLQWVDYPNVIKAYLGEEGLGGTGASVSWLAPWSQYTEFTYEFMNLDGEGSSGVFDAEADDYSHIFRANTFFEFGDNHNLELGASSLLSPVAEELGEDNTWLNGVDLTYRWDPAGDGSFRRFEIRTEIYGLRRTLELEHHDDHDDEELAVGYLNPRLAALADDDHEDEEHELSREDLFGMFASVGYRFNRWLEVNGRYDYVEGPFDPDLQETSWSAYLTYWQSEYAYWRLGWMRTEQELDNAEFDPVNRLWLQFNISLGPHPAHKY